MRAPSRTTGSRFNLAAALAMALALGGFARPAHAQGTWSKAAANGGCVGLGLWQLTDGRVLSHGCGASNTWAILTPDKTGSYATGTWKAAANSQWGTSGATQHVLKDGRFLEAGGEYIYVWPAHDGMSACSSGCSTIQNVGNAMLKETETYDPVTNTWTIQPDAPLEVADTGSVTLADGRLLYSSRSGAGTQIFDPSTNTWTNQNTNIPLGSGDENAWAALQNGNILAVGYAGSGAALYIPSMSKWMKIAVPSGFNTGDTGGISQMFDGRVYVYGLAGKSYVYTPGANITDPGTWATMALNSTNGAMEAEDEYTDTLPSGMVWGALVTKTYGPGVVLQQFDPTTNTTSSVTTETGQNNPYPIGYLNLPTGQTMIVPETGTNYWLYTPSASEAPQDAWRPTVTSVTFNSATNNYTLTGTQISGLINGADEGDDMTMQDNYPIIWLKDSSGNVTYCKSSNFSSMMPSKGSTPETADFTLPATITTGSYQLYVSAVGVQSKTGFAFTVGQSTSTGTGGTTGSGGTTGTGGTTGSGGTTGTGGTTGAGGATGAGGTTGSGGATSTGGSTGAGGSSSPGTGGTGVVSTGGTTGSGGASSAGTGGSTGQGGSPVTTGTGGTTGAGGTSSTGAGGTTGETGTGGTTGETGAAGCSCATAPGSGSSLTALFALAAALGLSVARRRRRQPARR